MKAVKNKSLTEAQFLQKILDLAHFLGWLTYHTRDSRGSEPGFPDLVLCHPQKGDYLMAELKDEDGLLSPSQIKWLNALRASGIEIHIWRPIDWEDIVYRLV